MNLNDHVREFKLNRFDDERGSFITIFEANKRLEAEHKFVMDNVSHSKKGVLRGLHYQKLQPQGKLVTVLQGVIFDVTVDIRKESKNYGQWKAFEVSKSKANQIWVPPGFAHGFLAIEESIVHYKTSDFYTPNDQYSIAWDDKDLAISWPMLDCEYILSERDQAGESFSKHGNI